MICITSKRNGFRRCGIAHPDTLTEYKNDHFSKAQLAQLQAEPMLVVQVLPDTKNNGSQSKTKVNATDQKKELMAMTMEELKAIGEKLDVTGTSKDVLSDAIISARTKQSA